jgi:hypothetical protein
VNAEVPHHCRDPIHPAIVVLDKLNLETLISSKLFPEVWSEILIRNYAQRVVDNHYIELPKIQYRAALQRSRIERSDIVRRIPAERFDMFQQCIRMPFIVIAQQ